MVFATIWIALGNVEGFILESDEGLVAYAVGLRRVVPVFARESHALLFIRQRDPHAQLEAGGDHDLRSLGAFALGTLRHAPPDAFDAWILLDEIAGAAGRRDECEDPHALAKGLAPRALPQADAAARRALTTVLRVAREVLLPLDTPRR